MQSADPAIIYFQCASGHKLRAAARLAGRSIKCPKCSEPAIVPQPDAPLSETGAFRILSECTESSVPTNKGPLLRDAKQKCPRCHKILMDGVTICCYCRLRLRDDDLQWKRTERDALKSLRR